MSCEHCEEEKTEYRKATWYEAAAIALIGPPALFVVAIAVAITVAAIACGLPFAALFGQIKVAK